MLFYVSIVHSFLSLSSILLHVYAKISSSTTMFYEHLSCSQALDITNKVACNTGIEVFMGAYVFLSFVWIPRRGMAWPYGKFALWFFSTTLFSKMYVKLIFSPPLYASSSCSTFISTFGTVCHFNFFICDDISVWFNFHFIDDS